MKRSSIFFIVTDVIFLILLILLPILLPNDAIVRSNSLLSLYVVTKVICALYLVGSIFFIIFSKIAFGMGVVFAGTAYFTQLIPLFIRLIITYVNDERSAIIGGVTLFLLYVMVLCVFIGASFYMNKKMVKSDEKSEGKQTTEIENSLDKFMKETIDDHQDIL